MPPELHFDLSTLDFNRIVYGKDVIREVLPHRFEFEQLDAIVHVEPSQNLIVGYFAMAPLVRQVFGFDPVSEEGIKRQTAFLHRVSHLLIPPRDD